MKISLVVFEIANPSNGVRGCVRPPLISSHMALLRGFDWLKVMWPALTWNKSDNAHLSAH